ncbi:hypothetical protein [Sulfolobus acidocaldarius]|uniref:Conserved protein n=4 Tax=Sulfolobus acidocaldarius TaxID=2285 RepID=Q4J6M9_SULAC|nr:hypothetical protein [Sulfolobus acidocaldarius]AHC52290.1 transcriptional regulator [Sulfolobus acidocaldarius SUSAZ]AAY81552.1 conserved protein [Sulfolobus acidocaldarius DSM 639]AGE72155.1 hypothetical protein SacN8_11045 [Sulfolobus acidocaldarius N8]AGE74472.1 hypothetical protein SacRon12I_11290 [Sulfolobus acidocaldarius Ron12/I]ALU29673.1 transcriptional regulator [Sulfolobus acidocaldarius]
MENLPPSAKLVLKILMERRSLRFRELKEETQLPTRTLYYALKLLKEKKVIKAMPCLDDTRERVYLVVESEECYKLFND